MSFTSLGQPAPGGKNAALKILIRTKADGHDAPTTAPHATKGHPFVVGEGKVGRRHRLFSRPKIVAKRGRTGCLASIGREAQGECMGR